MKLEIFVDGNPIFSITDTCDPLLGGIMAMECVGFALNKIKERDSLSENSFLNLLGDSRPL
jgi:hypothetical protein